MSFPYTDIIATTMDAWIEKGVAFDNIFKAHPLLEWLKTNTKLDKQGGEKISVNLEYGKAPVEAISGDDTYTLSKTPIIDKGIDEWRTVITNVQFNFEDKMKNRGEAQIVDLIEKRLENAEKSVAEQLEEWFFDAQTSKQPNGLLDIASATGTFMGIPRSTYTWWKGVVKGDCTTPATLTLPLMANTYNTVSGGTELPDFIITVQDLFEKYEALCQLYLQISNTKVGDAGFMELAYKNATMRFSGFGEDDKMFFLKSPYLYLVSSPDGFFWRDEFQKVSNKLVWNAPIVFWGNFMSSNCRRQGVLCAKATT